MSRIVIYMHANGMHSNVPAPKRRAYLERLPDWVRVLREARVPVVISIQAIDLLVAGLTEADFDGLDLLAAPFNHALFSVIGGRDGLPDHARWLVEHGVAGNVDGAAWPEFDTPNRDLHPGRSMVYFAVPDDAFLYSELDERSPSDETCMDAYRAVRFHSHVVVPMHGVRKAQSAFFRWQRRWDGPSRDEMVAAFRKIVEDGKDDVRVFFMDLEAPLVGSHHGLDVWKEFFRILREEGIARHVVGFREAETTWRAAAVKPSQTFALLARRLGNKWTAWNQQVILLARILRQRAARSDREHAAMACFTTSDLFSALGTQLDAVKNPPKPHDADLGPITIGWDPTVCTVGHLALDAYDTGKRLARALVAHAWDDPDARWFAERLAAAVESFSE